MAWSHLGHMSEICCTEAAFMFPLGMHPVRDHVREGEEGAAHGQELILWRGECLHHPSGGCKSLPFDL